MVSRNINIFLSTSNRCVTENLLTTEKTLWADLLFIEQISDNTNVDTGRRTSAQCVIVNTNDNEEPDVEFETIKLVEDEGKRVLIECTCMDLIRTMECRYPRIQEYLSGRVGTAGEEFYLTACKDIMLGLNGASGTQAYYHGAWSGGRVRSIKGSATIEFGGQTSGRCPHGAVPILFGKQDDPTDWWDVSRIGKAQIQLTPRATTDTNKNNVVVGQFKQRY